MTENKERNMAHNQTLFWIWLSEHLGAASKDFRRLISLYDNPYDLFHADEAEIERIPDISSATRKKLCDKELGGAYQILETCEALGIDVIPYDDARFPNSLRGIALPPVLLYCMGTLPDPERELCLAMVGTRKMSAYGLSAAYKIAYELAAAGACVVSGMAAGIDGVSSAAAMAAKGRTVAFLGCGVDVLYPKHHGPLRDRIVAQGALVSEYPPGSPPSHYHFPIRNRLISGFCSGTVVIEAGLGSGSLITARESVTQGKPVYALPANVGSRGAEGTNALIRDGAVPIISTRDILNPYLYVYSDSLRPEALLRVGDATRPDMQYLQALGVIELTERGQRAPAPAYVRATPFEAQKSAPKKEQQIPREPVFVPEAKHIEKIRRPKPSLDESLTPVQLAVLSAMPDDRAVALDEIRGVACDSGELLAALTMLELCGCVHKLPGSLYIKA